MFDGEMSETEPARFAALLLTEVFNKPEEESPRMRNLTNLLRASGQEPTTNHQRTYIGQIVNSGSHQFNSWMAIKLLALCGIVVYFYHRAKRKTQEPSTEKFNLVIEYHPDLLF